MRKKGRKLEKTPHGQEEENAGAPCSEVIVRCWKVGMRRKEEDDSCLSPALVHSYTALHPAVLAC